MSQYRKPIPKKQKQISKGLQDAFDTTRGNPNQTVLKDGNHINEMDIIEIKVGQ
jgi:hypothetical protein